MESRLNFIERIMDFKSGVLLLWSIPASLGITEILKKLFAGLKFNDLAMPLVVVFATLFLFTGLYAIDFILGISASRKKGIELTNQKRWESFFKFASVVILMFCMTVFNYLFLIMGLGFFYDAFLYIMVAVMVMICLYEFHSIGKNLEIIYGKKPRLFFLFDEISIALEKGIIKRIDKYLL